MQLVKAWLIKTKQRYKEAKYETVLVKETLSIVVMKFLKQ